MSLKCEEQNKTRAISGIQKAIESAMFYNQSPISKRNHKNQFRRSAFASSALIERNCKFFKPNNSLNLSPAIVAIEVDRGVLKI